MEFAQRLRHAMEDKSITAYRLAKELGVHQTTIKNWLDGKGEPHLAQLKRIAKILNADIIYLISGQTSAEVERGILIQAEAEAKYYVKGRFAEAETWKSRKDEIGEDLAKLNDDGQIEAVKRVKELTRLDEYRRGAEPSPLSAGIKVYGDGPAGSFLPASQPPAETPQSPIRPQDGTDTTPPPEGAEEPQERE